jgi:hypothetical protein
MSASPQRAPFIVPETSASTSAPKPPREVAPLLIVPTPLPADEREALEPHWHSAIDAATD